MGGWREVPEKCNAFNANSHRGEGRDVCTLMQKMMKGPMPIRNPYHPQNLINERREEAVGGGVTL